MPVYGEVVTAINTDLGFQLGSVWNGWVLKIPRRINWRASLVPAAAVIPAPMADVDSAAVKKLVVEFWPLFLAALYRGVKTVVRACWERGFCAGSLRLVYSKRWGSAPFTVRKSRCSKRALRSKASARNDKIRSGRSCWFIERVMVNRNSWGYSYWHVRGEILGLCQDERLRKHLPRMFSLIKNESWGIDDD